MWPRSARIPRRASARPFQRRPPTLPTTTERRSSRPPDAVERAIRGAEADLEGDEMLAGQRRSSRRIYLVLFLILAGALGFLGWEIVRRAEEPLPPTPEATTTSP